MELLLVVGLLSVLGTFSTVYCIRDEDLYITEYFDPNTGGKAAGTLSCTQDNERLDISSVTYYYRDLSSNNHPCTYNCPEHSDTFLDGTHSVCQNENNIRSTCYARNSCSFNNITKPPIVCSGDGGENAATHVRIYYRCIDSDYVFNLCEDREMIVTKQTQIILTSPLSSDDTYRKLSCKCVLSSRYTNQPLNQNVTLTRLRMAQLFGGDVVTYGYGYQQTPYSTQYNRDYLPKEIPIPVGQYNSNEASVKINNTNPVAGDSRVFFSIEPGKDITVTCGNDVYVKKTVDTSTKSSIDESTSTDTTTSRIAIATSTDTTTSSSLPPVTSSNEVSSSTDGSIDSSMLVIIAVVVVVMLALICIAVVAAICLVKRKRRARAEKFAVSLSENNNVEMSPLRPAGAEDTYHELEEPDERYDIIPVDGTYAEVGADVDPYKVTDLQDDPPSAANLQRTRTLAANEYASHNDKQVRNSRGSIDVYTENSTITEDHYSQPCDVLLKDGEEDNSATRQYDTPAEVTYAAIQKPLGKTNSVELIDNELYGT